MPKLTRKTAILAAIEAIKGTEVVPIAANAIEVSDLTVTPLEGDSVERNIIRPYFGASGSVMVCQYRKLAFSVECAGVAALGDVPGYAMLLRACACSMTVNAGADVRFAPVTDGLESLTIYVVMDGIRYKLRSAMGTAKLQGDAKTLPKWQFEFTGTYEPAEDVAGMPAVNYAAFVTPFGVNKANTTLSLHGVAVACSAFSFDMGLTVVKRDLINVDTVEITDRKTTGSVTIEATSVAEKDWIGLARTSAVGELHFVHGPNATNVVEINATRVQLGKPTFSDSDGIQMIQIPLSYVPTSVGNDEFEIAVH